MFVFCWDFYGNKMERSRLQGIWGQYVHNPLSRETRAARKASGLDRKYEKLLENESGTYINQEFAGIWGLVLCLFESFVKNTLCYS